MCFEEYWRFPSFKSSSSPPNNNSSNNNNDNNKIIIRVMMMMRIIIFCIFLIPVTEQLNRLNMGYDEHKTKTYFTPTLHGWLQADS
jgi:hypothetical protein